MEQKNNRGNGSPTGWSLQKDTPAKRKTKLFRLVLCILFLGAGIMAAKYFINTPPKAKRLPPPKMAPLVRVQSVFPETQMITISAMGTVIPARKVAVKARVTGEIVRVHAEFKDGGILKKGAEILRIDDADYKLNLAKKKSAIITAQYALALEKGRQAVAKREWQLLNKNDATPMVDATLALRIPHLKKAMADLASAEADLQQATLDLERTRILAPFNAIIQARYVDMGSQATPQGPLADLVAIDEYWIRVAIPVDHLPWIATPGDNSRPGADARIYQQTGNIRTGSVIKLLSDLTPEGRMARLLVSVHDPLALSEAEISSPPLLIGEYVRVKIKGRHIENAYRIPRTAFRDNNHLWIAGKDNKLEIREITPIWRDETSLFFKDGLSAGERLVLTNISTPVPGMPITIDVEETSTTPSEQRP